MKRDEVASEHASPALKRLGRPLAIWLGSFVIIATLLIVYAGMPLGPILLAGGGTLLITILQAARHPGSRV